RSWRDRHDRYLGWLGRRGAAPRGSVGGRDRDQPRTRPVLGGRGRDGRGRERRRIRAPVHHAARVRGRQRVHFPRGDGSAVEPHRHLPARGGRSARRRSAPRPHHTSGVARRLRSLRVSVRTLWYYVVLVASTVAHAVTAIVAG